MTVLNITQHQDDVVVIRMGGQSVRIYISSVHRGSVRLAIDAPQSVEIERISPMPAELPEPEVISRRVFFRR